MDGKIPLRSGKPFMLRQGSPEYSRRAQHERLAGLLLLFKEVIFNEILSVPIKAVLGSWIGHYNAIDLFVLKIAGIDRHALI
jgi:hypothetical protein